MPESNQKPMDTAITFVLASEDKARIKLHAKAEYRTVSNWVRAVIEAELRRREAKEDLKARNK